MFVHLQDGACDQFSGRVFFVSIAATQRVKNIILNRGKTLLSVHVTNRIAASRLLKNILQVDCHFSTFIGLQTQDSTGNNTEQP